MINNTTIVPHGHALGVGFSSGVASYFIFVVMCSVSFNLLLMAVILIDKRLHTVTNVFIVNLAVGDFITGVAVIPFDIDFLLRGHFPHQHAVCAFKETVFMLSLPSSVVNLLLMTIERFVSIHFPFKWNKLFTRFNIALSITASWVYTINVALVPLYYGGINSIVVDAGQCWLSFPMEYAYYQVGVNFALPIVVILMLNFSLFQLSCRHQKDIRRKSIDQKKKSTQSMLSKTMMMNMKTAKVVLLLTSNFIICWLSFVVLVTLNILCNGCHTRQTTWLGNAVNYSNILLNPLLYGFFNKPVRVAASRLFTKLLPCKAASDMSRTDSGTFLSMTTAHYRRESTLSQYNYRRNSNVATFAPIRECRETEAML